jgi:hypothetical protein
VQLNRILKFTFATTLINVLRNRTAALLFGERENAAVLFGQGLNRV